MGFGGRRRPAEAALCDPDQRAGNEVGPPKLDVSVTGQAMQDTNLILVVDDDPGMLKAVQRLLRQHAYEPIVFSSAQAFKSHADFEKAAAVILDINLPDGSGIELRQV